ncbi:MAG: endonuclease/exonuclease/phosphatase family protein [Puniceicoccales bacterium]|jgi:endonuclease/exonuclease/phosphatase family metal-dependent hydrolase|nr:endonuclease/exonuclease/phosphatase family protein [Puniceicoccales bacterium]
MIPKTRFLLILFLYFAASLFSFAAETLRVASFNAQNYNLLNFRRVEGRTEPDYPKPEAEKKALRFMILAANADVLALQEIGGEPFVKELCRDLARSGFPYPHTAVLSGPDPSRQLAILSRRPFKHVWRYPEIKLNPKTAQNNPLCVARGLLGVTLDTPAGELFFYTVHLKSRLDSKGDPLSANRRLAEADAICRILSTNHPPRNLPARVLVAGDFNDDPHAAPLRRFTYAKRPPALFMLPARDSRNETWTYRNFRNDYYSRSDYFLYSAALEPHLRKPAKIADLPASEHASDHRLLIAELNFP